MFNYVPLPPKDYHLREVPKCQRDAPQFTPDSEPRVTQSNVGVFCYPIEYGEGETPEKIEVPPISPFIMDKFANEARAFWVDKPGKDDFFLHDMCKKYSVKFDDYNPAYRHMEKVFNRSYKYELVCLEDRRLQKLRDKCEREQTMWEDEFNRVGQKEHEEKYPPMKVLGCTAKPPFWWKETDEDAIQEEEKEEENEVKPKFGKGIDKLGHFSGRWAEEPCLTAAVVDDPCRRRYEMELVGQPFKSEACNFYYANYPPPDLEFRPKRFV